MEAKAEDEITEGEDKPKEKRAPPKKQAAAEEEVGGVVPSDNWWIVTHWNKKTASEQICDTQIGLCHLGRQTMLDHAWSAAH